MDVMTDLQFLYQASNDDLVVLCDIITKDKKGEFRLTEELSATDAYKAYYPNNIKRMLPELIDELSRFGGNTFVNMIRKGGAEYGVILRDVAKRNKVSFNKQSTDDQVEQYLLQKLFNDSLDKASDDELKEMLNEFGFPTTNFTRQGAVALLMTTWRAGGFKSYMLLVSVANAVVKALIGRGLSLAANAGLTRLFSILTGPVGWVITSLWTAYDIAGPAYRVTTPAVIQIAYIRQSINRFAVEKSNLLK